MTRRVRTLFAAIDDVNRLFGKKLRSLISGPVTAGLYVYHTRNNGKDPRDARHGWGETLVTARNPRTGEARVLLANTGRALAPPPPKNFRASGQKIRVIRGRIVRSTTNT